MAHAADRGLVWIRRWRSAAIGGVCQLHFVGIVQFPLVPGIKSLRKPKKSGLRPEVNDWLRLAQGVLDESGFRAYYVRGGWGLNLLSVGKVCTFE